MPILYKHRIIESELRLRLASAGAIVIEGPKACGKTATAETLAASVVLLDVDEQARRAADVEPALVLAGKAPRLIAGLRSTPAGRRVASAVSHQPLIASRTVAEVPWTVLTLEIEREYVRPAFRHVRPER